MGEVTLNPYAYLVDTQGTALDGGLIYIGQPNQDPQATPIALFYDAALTIAAPNPLPTLGGFAVRNGSPALVYAAESSYSLKVVDQIGVQVLSEPSFYGVDARISDAVAALNTDLTTRFESADNAITATADLDRANRIAADNAIIASTSAQDTVLLNLINALANGSTKAYLTYAALDAAKATLPANSFARVTNDPTPANNWLWQWNGTILTKSARDDLAVALAAIDEEAAAREASILNLDTAMWLYVTALRQTILDQRNITADHSFDPAFLRDIALRQTIVEQRGVAASFATDLSVFKQSPATATIATDAQTLELAYSVTDRVLSLHSRSALKNQGRAVYLAGDITIPAPTSGSVASESITLVFTTAAYVFASLGRLANAPVQNVVVSGNSGVAWTLNAEQGALVRTTSGANQAATVAYDWSRVRYDLIEADPIAGTLHRVAGTERNRDVAEYLPTPTAGRIPILIVRTTAWEITARPYADAERQSHNEAARIQRARARKMPNLHAKLRAGLPVVIAGYGDSRTNLGGTPSVPFAANGTARDTLATSGFLMTQGSDFVSSIPLFDFGDGAGAVHTRIGWNWDLLRALQARYPGAHSYLNFGIGGTDSSATGNNGTVPARLAALTSSGATVATIAFGMNELGTTGAATTANLIAIGSACIAANIDPVFIAPARPNQAGWVNTLDRWLIECQQVKAAADALGAPYIDPVLIYGADLAAWLDNRDTCTSNGYNHDSVAELNAIGQLLTRIILDF